MVALAIVPVITVLLLLLLVVVVTNSRAKLVREAVVAVENEAADKLHRDSQNDQELFESILRGELADQAVPRAAKVRSEILAGANPEESAKWTTKQFDMWKHHELRKRVEEVNGRLIVPAFAGAIFIVTACTVTTAVLYVRLASASPNSPPPQEIFREQNEPIPKHQEALDDLDLPPVAPQSPPDVLPEEQSSSNQPIT